MTAETKFLGTNFYGIRPRDNFRIASIRRVRRVSTGVLRGIGQLYRFAAKPSIKMKNSSGKYHGRPRASLFCPPIAPLRPTPPPKEKRFLELAERGDKATLERCINNGIDVNCCDVLGRTALEIAVDNENIEIVELLLRHPDIKVGHALLYGIREGVYRITEMMIDHDSIKRDSPEVLGDGWRKSLEHADALNFEYSADITPIMLASHLNQFEILKLLKDRGASIEKPHSLSCSCSKCEEERISDHLRHSLRRLHAYRALASPAWISLTSTDPILDAFRLSWELQHLAYQEFEFRELYLRLCEQCKTFSCDLLSQCRSSEEVIAVLNKDIWDSMEDEPVIVGSKLSLSRLKLALKYEQKQFVAHPHCQQLLTSIWYEGFPGRQERGSFVNYLICLLLILAWPVLALVYIAMPTSRAGQIVRSPFMKFLYYSASFSCFLGLLTVQTFENYRFESSVNGLRENPNVHIRGPLPSFIESLIVIWVLGMVWAECKQLWEEGFRLYLAQWWNWLDYIMMSLYLCTFAARGVVIYYRLSGELKPAVYDRSQWQSDEPLLISESIFAVANIFSFARIIYLFQTNPYLGPLQISLGCMIIDIIKFFVIFLLVLTSFAIGLHQLYWYYSAPAVQLTCLSSNCKTNTGVFATIQDSYITLIWSLFSITNTKDTELEEEHHFTEWIGRGIYIAYHVTSIIVLLNMLIAMMSSSFQLINENSDLEWKFHRSKLWMSFFDEGSSLPAPFNIIITPKSIYRAFKAVLMFLKNKICGNQHFVHKGDRNKRATIRRPGYNRQRWQSMKRRKSREDEKPTYREIMERLVHRYIHMMKKEMKMDGVNEDDLLEIKQDISSLRYELREDRRTEILRSSSHIDGVKREIIRSLSIHPEGGKAGYLAALEAAKRLAKRSAITDTKGKFLTPEDALSDEYSRKMNDLSAKENQQSPTGSESENDPELHDPDSTLPSRPKRQFSGSIRSTGSGFPENETLREGEILNLPSPYSGSAYHDYMLPPVYAPDSASPSPLPPYSQNYDDTESLISTEKMFEFPRRPSPPFDAMEPTISESTHGDTTDLGCSMKRRSSARRFPLLTGGNFPGSNQVTPMNDVDHNSGARTSEFDHDISPHLKVGVTASLFDNVVTDSASPTSSSTSPLTVQTPRPHPAEQSPLIFASQFVNQPTSSPITMTDIEIIKNDIILAMKSEITNLFKGLTNSTTRDFGSTENEDRTEGFYDCPMVPEFQGHEGQSGSNINLNKGRSSQSPATSTWNDNLHKRPSDVDRCKDHRDDAPSLGVSQFNLLRPGDSGSNRPSSLSPTDTFRLYPPTVTINRVPSHTSSIISTGSQSGERESSRRKKKSVGINDKPVVIPDRESVI